MNIEIAREAKGLAQSLAVLADGGFIAISYSPLSASELVGIMRDRTTRSDVNFITLFYLICYLRLCPYSSFFCHFRSI